MFTSTTQRHATFGGLFGVGLVVAGWLAVAVLLVQTYTHATDGVSPAADRCELVCRPTVPPSQG